MVRARLNRRMKGVNNIVSQQVRRTKQRALQIIVGGFCVCLSLMSHNLIAQAPNLDFGTSMFSTSTEVLAGNVDYAANADAADQTVSGDVPLVLPFINPLLDDVNISRVDVIVDTGSLTGVNTTIVNGIPTDVIDMVVTINGSSSAPVTIVQDGSESQTFNFSTPVTLMAGQNTTFTFSIPSGDPGDITQIYDTESSGVNPWFPNEPFGKAVSIYIISTVDDQIREWTVGDGPLAIASPDTNITDIDNTNMAGGVVTLTNPFANDIVTIGGTEVYNNGAIANSPLTVGNITYTMTLGGGGLVMTLTGTDTNENYADAFEAIQYSNSSFTPNLTDRIFTAVVSDGTSDSNIVTSTVRVLLAPDTDGDTIPDVADLDDDNDGILDVEECPTVDLTLLSYANRNGQVLSPSEYATTATVSGGTLSDSGGVFHYLASEASPSYTIAFSTSVSNVHLHLGSVNPSSEIGNFNLVLEDGTVVNNADFILSYNPDVDVLGGLGYEAAGSSNFEGRFVKSQGAPFGAGVHFVDDDGTAALGSQYWGILLFEGYETNPIASISFSIATGSSNHFVGIVAQPKLSCDFDNDGIENQFDLDSDNDNCPDFVEGGGTFTEATNGQPAGGTLSDGNGGMVTTNLPTPVGTTAGVDEGVPTVAGTGQAIGSSQNGAVENCTDTDGDSVPDSVDLDDDNDGILDTDEYACVTADPNFNMTLPSGAVPPSGFDNSPWEPTHMGASVTIFSGGIVFGAGLPATQIEGVRQSFPTVSGGQYIVNLSYLTTTGTIARLRVFDENNVALIDDLTIDTSGSTVVETASGSPVIFTGNGNNFTVEFELLDNPGSLVLDTLQVCYLDFDTDNDGIPNRLDLDSDGDGCPDALEGDGSFVQGDLATSTINGGNTGTDYTGTSTTPVQDNLTGDLSGVADPVTVGIVNNTGQVTQVDGTAVTPAVNQAIGTSQNGTDDTACCTVEAPVVVPD